MRELGCALQDHATNRKNIIIQGLICKCLGWIFYINYNIKRVDILLKDMNIYPNTCSLQEDPKDSKTGQVNFTFLAK